MEMFQVKYLSIETIDDLSHALEISTLTNWKELMGSNTFASTYSAHDINKIQMTGKRPAKALIKDLISREIPLQDLLSGLKEIGNRKAISIIERDKVSKGFNMQYSGGRPPSLCVTRQPQEHDMASSSYAPLIQRGEQTETLVRHPVQESGINEDSRVPRRHGCMEIVSRFFPGLSFLEGLLRRV